MLLRLAQEVEVMLAAGPNVNNFGKVAGSVESVAFIIERKGEWQFERNLRLPHERSVQPSLPVKSNFAPAGHGVDERLIVGRKTYNEGFNAWQ